MKHLFETTTAGLMGLTALCLGPINAGSAESTPPYSVVSEIPGAGDSWDYAVIDEQGERLYLAQGGVTALDLKTNKLTTGLLAGKTTHGLTVLGDGLVAVDDSADRTVKVFEGVSGKIVATIPTEKDNPVKGHHALDAMVLEPKSGLVVAINGDSGLLVLIDVKQAKVVATVSIGGKPEFAAADGKGVLYVNVNQGKKSEIVAVDIVARKITAHIALKGCVEATGLAYDQTDHLLISVCGNGMAKFIRADTGVEAAMIPVGRGADAVMFDEHRHRAFIPSAADGRMSVIAVRSPSDVAKVQTVATQGGTRLGAVDVNTGKVYLPAAKFGLPVPPNPYPSVTPGSFKILVVAPN
jgi:DNA-binding beta-propeller fold protein YncE